MLEVFTGDNISEVRQKAFSFAHACAEKGRNLTHITTDQYEDGMLLDLSGSNALFGGTETIVLDTPSEDDVFFDAVQELVEVLKESVHTFVVIEPSLSASEKKVFAKHANLHEIAGTEKAKFNTFALTDALLLRDKKTLWLLLMEAWKKGVNDEEIIGVLFWQLKSLRLVAQSASAEEAGLKPFVYQKAKRALIKFKDGDLERLSRTLLDLYHKGHSGQCDISLQLEKWVLTL